MAKKPDSFYFENFIACADYACKAAHLLEQTLKNFNVNELHDRIAEMHEVEHAADNKKHELLQTLSRAFITPIEREDIMQLGQNIDEITDKVEDVLFRIYFNHIDSIRPDALEMIRVIIRCCEAVRDLMTEFADFRRSKTLRDHIIRINTMEEEADNLFIASMYKLHAETDHPVQIIIWREVYIYLEKCADACEHAADVVESILLKNS